MYFSPRLSCSFSKLCMTQVVSLLLQTQPDADVLAVQPQDAADVPGDHPDASQGPPPHFPGRLLLLQRGEQTARERGLRPGHGERGEHPPGPLFVLAEGGALLGQRRGLFFGPQGELRGAPHALHAHERGQEQWTNTSPAPLHPLLTKLYIDLIYFHFILNRAHSDLHTLDYIDVSFSQL